LNGGTTSDTVVQNELLKNFIYNYKEYLVTPSRVAYQSTESAVATMSAGYNNANDAYGTPSKGSYWTGDDYSSKTNYASWSTDDYLWLPSWTETGDTSTAGIWNLNASQLASDNIAWLRSGIVANYNGAYYIGTSGDRSNAFATTDYGIRPAIHVNLEVGAQSAGISSTSTADENLGNLYSGGSFNQKTLTNLAVSAGYTSIEDLVAGVKSYVAENNKGLDATTFAKKSNGDDAANGVTITLGGYEWIPVYLSTNTSGQVVLTLYLAQPTAGVNFYSDTSENANVYDSSILRSTITSTYSTLIDTYKAYIVQPKNMS
jgi:hypothetical protein